MKCPNCRCEILVAQRTCPYCGYLLTSNRQTQIETERVTDLPRSSYRENYNYIYAGEEARKHYDMSATQSHENDIMQLIYELKLHMRILMALTCFCIILLLLLLLALCILLN